MAQLLLIADDPITLINAPAILRKGGHEVVTHSSKQLRKRALDNIDLVVADLRLLDALRDNVLREAGGGFAAVPLIVLITDSDRATELGAALRLGVSDFVVKPISEGFLWTIDRALGRSGADHRAEPFHGEPQAYAVARWARALVPIVDCPTDPRTIGGWSRWIAASPGAVRNWCATAGIGTRYSLVFARILRAVVLADGGRRKPENLLDVVDRRTLSGLLRTVGLSGKQCLPASVDEFLDRQTLVRDPDALREVRRAMEALRQQRQQRLTSSLR